MEALAQIGRIVGETKFPFYTPNVPLGRIQLDFATERNPGAGFVLYDFYNEVFEENDIFNQIPGKLYLTLPGSGFAPDLLNYYINDKNKFDPTPICINFPHSDPYTVTPVVDYAQIVWPWVEEIFKGTIVEQRINALFEATNPYFSFYDEPDCAGAVREVVKESSRGNFLNGLPVTGSYSITVAPKGGQWISHYNQYPKEKTVDKSAGNGGNSKQQVGK